MKDGNERKADGIIDKVAGKVKEAVGKATDNDSLKREGQKDQFKGNVKEKTGDVQRDLERDDRR